MGRAKDEWLRQQEKGWSSAGDKFVCADCFDDYAIKAFICSHVSEATCSYCGRAEGELIAAPIDEVLSHIADGINSEYEDAANSVAWESAEGGYLLSTMDSADLLATIGLDVEGELQEDIENAFSERAWVHQDPYGDLRCDSLRYTWEAFADQVKHRTRFVFFRIVDPNPGFGESEPHDILKSLGEIAIEVGLLKDLPVGTRFFRARQHEVGIAPNTMDQLSAPPTNLASHSRMSPAGISMLYLANNSATASAEVLLPNPAKLLLTMAEFETNRSLRVLDLSTIPSVPSLFDEDQRHQRMALIFMRHFATDVSRAIDSSAAPYEYVPTQVVTEYFRHLFKDDQGRSLDGIAYKSSKNNSGLCYTLFLDQDACLHDTDRGPPPIQLVGAKTKPISLLK